MENYKSNSHKSKEEPEKKVERVVTGSVKTKKKSEIRKLADIFVPQDVESVRDYALHEVIVPLIKRGISDIVDILLYGESGGSKKRSTASKISYNSYYQREGETRRDYNSVRNRGGYDYEDIVLNSRGEAEAVLDRMHELMHHYKVVSVADFYDLCGITGNYTDNKYGWEDIRSATISHTRDGYIIKLPRAVPLD